MKLQLTPEQSSEVLSLMSDTSTVIMSQPFRRTWPENHIVDIVFTAIPKETAVKIQKILK